MARRSPAKKKKTASIPSTNQPTEDESATDNSAQSSNPFGSSAPSLSSTSLPRLAPSSEAEEPWSPTRGGLRSPSRSQAHQVSSLQAENAALETELWTARGDLQKMQDQRKANEELISKITIERNRLRGDTDTSTAEIEYLKSREQELLQRIKQLSDSKSFDRKNLSNQQINHDQYVENLLSQIAELKSSNEHQRDSERLYQQKLRELQENGSASTSGIDESFLSSLDEGDSTSDLHLDSTNASSHSISSDLLSNGARHARQNRALRNTIIQMRKELAASRQKVTELQASAARERATEDNSFHFGHSPVRIGPAFPGTSDEDPHQTSLDGGFEHHQHGDDTISSSLEAAIPEISVSDGVPLSEEYVPDEKSFKSIKETEVEIPSTLHDQARVWNHTLVPTSEYEYLSQRGQEPLAEELKVEDLQRIAERLDYTLLSTKELNHVHELIHGKVPVNPDGNSHVLQDLLQRRTLELAADSSMSRTRSNTSSHSVPPSPQRREDLSLISDIHDNDTSSESVYTTVAGGNISGNISLSELKRRAYNPTASEIASQAASHGLAVLPLGKFDEIKAEQMALKSEIDKRHSAAEIAQLAGDVGCKLIPNNPSPDELQGILGDDIVFVYREAFEANERPGPATLTRLAKHHGLVVMPESEAIDLRASKTSNRTISHSSDSSYVTARDIPEVADKSENHSPDTSLTPHALDPDTKSIPQESSSMDNSSPTQDVSVERLRELAGAHGHVLLSAANYKSMLGAKSPEGKYTNLPVSERAKFMQELLDSQRQSGSGGSPTRSRNSPAYSSLGSVEDRMRRMGYVLVEQDEYQKLKESQRVYEPTKADIIKSAKEFGLATMPLDEFRKLRETKWRNKNSNENSPRVSPSKTRADSSDVSDSTSEFKTVPAIYLQGLRQIVEQPQQENIEALARKANIKLSELVSYEELKSRVRDIGLEDLLTPDEIIAASDKVSGSRNLNDDQIISRAKELGLKESIPESEIISRARACGLVDPLSKEQILIEAKKYGLTDPLSIDEIKSKARTLGLVDPLTDNEILEKAKSIGLVEKPSVEDVKTQAKNHGLVDPPSDEEILTRATGLGLRGPLNKDEILANARELGLIDRPSDEEILSKAKQLGLVTPLSENEITSKAKLFGMVFPLTDKEVIDKAKSLGLANPLTKKEILEKAKKYGLVDVPSDDDILESAKKLGLIEAPTREQIITQGKKNGLVDPISDDEIVTKGKQLGLVDPTRIDELIPHVEKLGMIRPPTDEQTKRNAKTLGLIEPLSDEEIINRGKSLGLVWPLSGDEIKSRASSAGMVEPLSKDKLISKALKLGLVNPPSDDNILAKAKSLGLIEPLSDKDIIAKSESLGLVKAPGKDQIISQAKSLGLTEPLSDKQIVAKAKKLGLSERLSDPEILAQARRLGYAKPLTNNEILLQAKKQGLVESPTDAEIVEKAHKFGLYKPPTDEEILSKAKSLGLVEYASDQDALSRGKSLGLVEPLNEDRIVSKAKTLGLQYPPSDEAIIARAKSLGLIYPLTEPQLISEAKKLGLTDPLSKDSIVMKAKSLGLTKPLSNEEILAKARSQGLSEPPPKDIIMSKAKALGLVEPPTDSEIIAKAKVLGLSEPPSKDAIILKAKSMGFSRPLSKEEILSEAKNLGLTEPLTSSEIITKAKAYGLVEKSDNAEAHKSDETQARVKSASNARSEPEVATSHDSKAVPGQEQTCPDHDPSDVSALTTETNANSFVLTDEHNQPDHHNTVMQKPSSSAKASMYRRRIGSSTHDMSLRSRSRSPVKSSLSPMNNHSGSYRQSPMKRAPVPSLSSSRSIDNFKSATSPTKATIPRSQTTRTLDPHRKLHSDGKGRCDSVSTGEFEDYALPLPHVSSFRGLASSRRPRSNSNTSRGTQSSWSISTLLSSDDPERLISQVMVGENLYKYYHGIQIENITGGRHRRYFWFRPETKTLYWHSEGHAIFSNGLAKQITVVGVEEIADTNQLPVQLYQRSLLIKGKERDIMVTCQTRTRHYVWLSSLRYALEPKN